MSSNDRVLDEVLKRLDANQRVLFIWSGKQVPTDLQPSIERIQAKTGVDTKVNVEHADRLGMSNHAKSSFDVILANVLTFDSAFDSSQLVNYLNLLKPKGRLVVFTTQPGQSLVSELKLNGFMNAVETRLDGQQIGLVQAEKPDFEVGSASRLKFAKSSTNAASEDKKPKVWQFNPNDIAEDDLINTDELLDELDLKKPVLVDKFDCGESKTG